MPTADLSVEHVRIAESSRAEYLAGHPELEAYLGRVALIPAMAPGFYKDLIANKLPYYIDNDPFAYMEDDAEVEQLDGGHYAWIGMLRWLHYRTEAYDKTEGPLAKLDIASAVPMYTELHRSRDFTRAWRYAKDAVGEVLNDFTSDPEVDLISLDDRSLNLVREFLGRRRSDTRQLLISHIRAVLYTLSESETSPQCEPWETRAIMMQRLMFEIHYGKTMYKTGFDGRHYEGRLQIDTTCQDVDNTLLELVSRATYPPTKEIGLEAKQKIDRLAAEEIAKLGETRNQREATRLRRDIHRRISAEVRAEMPPPAEIGERLASDALYIIANRVIHKLVSTGRARAFSTRSVDLAPPLKLYDAAEQSFDKQTRDTGLYHRTRTRLWLGPEFGGGHDTASVLDPAYWEKIPDNSIVLLTSIEGFPFLFSSRRKSRPGELTLVQLAEVMFRKLSVNGYLVIFPWGIDGKLAEKQSVLKDMKGRWKEDGAKVVTETYTREELQAAMSKFEVDSLQYESAIFNNDTLLPEDQFELMVVHKAQASLVLNQKMKARREREAQRLTYELGTGEVPGGDYA